MECKAKPLPENISPLSPGPGGHKAQGRFLRSPPGSQQAGIVTSSSTQPSGTPTQSIILHSAALPSPGIPWCHSSHSWAVPISQPAGAEGIPPWDSHGPGAAYTPAPSLSGVWMESSTCDTHSSRNSSSHVSVKQTWHCLQGAAARCARTTPELR